MGIGAALSEGTVVPERTPAADSTASTIFLYPVQRQTFPRSACLISGRVGLEFRSSKAFALRSMPGVQNPHWMAPLSTKARCSGCGSWNVPMPSMVLICRPSIWDTFVTQDLVGVPSISTVHEPHAPSPQPSLAPVRPNSSRKTSMSLRPGSPQKATLAPLRTNAIESFGDPTSRCTTTTPLALRASPGRASRTPAGLRYELVGLPTRMLTFLHQCTTVWVPAVKGGASDDVGKPD